VYTLETPFTGARTLRTVPVPVCHAFSEMHSMPRAACWPCSRDDITRQDTATRPSSCPTPLKIDTTQAPEHVHAHTRMCTGTGTTTNRGTHYNNDLSNTSTTLSISPPKLLSEPLPRFILPLNPTPASLPLPHVSVSRANASCPARLLLPPPPFSHDPPRSTG